MGMGLEMGMELVGALVEVGAKVEFTGVAPMKKVAVKAKGCDPNCPTLGIKMFRKLWAVILLMEPVTSSGLAPGGH